MKNKTLAWVFGIAILAIVVYAGATDTDGGYDPEVQGVCTDNETNSYTDYCLDPDNLREYEPVGVHCEYSDIGCDCADGACTG